MNLFTKLLLGVLYVFICCARAVCWMLGRDTLQLKRANSRSSYWLVRTGSPDVQSYFSELSALEGKRTRHEGSEELTDRGAAHLFVPVLRVLARLHVASRSVPGDKFSTAADREQGIPDEVYTLW